MTEREVRSIVRSMIKKDVLNKSEVKKIAKAEADKASDKVSKDAMTEKEVKEMIRNTLHAYHKFMWEKKGIWMKQI